MAAKAFALDHRSQGAESGSIQERTWSKQTNSPRGCPRPINGSGGTSSSSGGRSTCSSWSGQADDVGEAAGRGVAEQLHAEFGAGISESFGIADPGEEGGEVGQGGVLFLVRGFLVLRFGLGTGGGLPSCSRKCGFRIESSLKRICRRKRQGAAHRPLICFIPMNLSMEDSLIQNGSRLGFH